MLIVAGDNGGHAALIHQHEASKLSSDQQGGAGVSYSVQTGDYLQNANDKAVPTSAPRFGQE